MRGRVKLGCPDGLKKLYECPPKRVETRDEDGRKESKETAKSNLFLLPLTRLSSAQQIASTRSAAGGQQASATGLCSRLSSISMLELEAPTSSQRIGAPVTLRIARAG